MVPRFCSSPASLLMSTCSWGLPPGTSGSARAHRWPGDLPLLGSSSLPGVRSIPDAPPSPQPMAALCPSHSCLLLPVPLSSGSIPHSPRLLQSPYSSVTPVSLFEFISSVLPESSFQTPISWHPSPALQSKVYFFLAKN